MDYKTNILHQEVKTEDNLLPDIPDLHFGVLGENRFVFDYTEYIEANQLDTVDYKSFMRANKRFIEILAQSVGKSTTELFYQNTNGHILVASELVYIFLAYVNPIMLIYFNSLLNDALTDGMAFSHGFIYSMAANRLPSDVLTDIIREREDDAARNEQ